MRARRPGWLISLGGALHLASWVMQHERCHSVLIACSMKTLLACLSFVLLSAGVQSAELLVSEPEEARKAVRDAMPGDVIVLKSGEWKDVDLRLDGEGIEANQITIRAEEPGKTIFTGASRIRLGGKHLVVSGIWMKNVSGADADWFEFRIDSKRRAYHCRITDCAFTEEAEFVAKENENRWIGLYGSDNQMNHCLIEGKKNKGTTVVVWLGDDDTGRHRLTGNFFGERPLLGENGGETIRIGDSESSMMTAECLVEGNLFYRCDGETECISNKSCGNIYRGNLFREVQGTLTLRHGNDCLVEGNVFLGERRARTGGIRIIGESHRVIGNYLRDLEGDGFRSGISVLNGFPDSPANGYLQVKNALVSGNVLVNCKESLLVGHNYEDEATLPPLNCRFEKNRIIARSGRPAVRVELAPIGAVWESNAIKGEVTGFELPSGVAQEEVDEIEFPSLPEAEKAGVSWMDKK